MAHRLKNKVTDRPLKFSNFMKNEKETVKMLSCVRGGVVVVKRRFSQLQFQLGGENYLQDLLHQEKETHLKRGFSCKKGILMTCLIG
jgi:hypothetical protein